VKATHRDEFQSMIDAFHGFSKSILLANVLMRGSRILSITDLLSHLIQPVGPNQYCLKFVLAFHLT
jgi:hypothetical protein